jgi:hypothetical protein
MYCTVGILTHIDYETLFYNGPAIYINLHIGGQPALVNVYSTSITYQTSDTV